MKDPKKVIVSSKIFLHLYEHTERTDPFYFQPKAPCPQVHLQLSVPVPALLCIEQVMLKTSTGQLGPEVVLHEKQTVVEITPWTQNYLKKKTPSVKRVNHYIHKHRFKVFYAQRKSHHKHDQETLL